MMRTMNGGDAMLDVCRYGNVMQGEDRKNRGGTSKAISLFRGEVHQVTIHAICWAGDYSKTSSLQERLWRRCNYLCTPRTLDTSAYFSIFVRVEILKL